ncbi:hypothetical protein J7W08_00560 [Methanococcoides orientis]|nr:hypothetical protein [Methanococcoides orientis]UGV40869.1 hypothetical protein J7W08_00560 [Methanococcoides orientis]
MSLYINFIQFAERKKEIENTMQIKPHPHNTDADETDNVNTSAGNKRRS